MPRGRRRKSPATTTEFSQFLSELTQRPGWTDERIWTVLKVSRSQLYRWKAGALPSAWFALRDFLEVEAGVRIRPSLSDAVDDEPLRTGIARLRTIYAAGPAGGWGAIDANLRFFEAVANLIRELVEQGKLTPADLENARNRALHGAQLARIQDATAGLQQIDVGNKMAAAAVSSKTHSDEGRAAKARAGQSAADPVGEAARHQGSPQTVTEKDGERSWPTKIVRHGEPPLRPPKSSSRRRRGK